MTETHEDRPVVNVVIGTAGHIDHGKSSLIERLTGTHPSRLKEERARGMTIDIGYAEFPVSEEVTAGIIDVPGHEKFIRNMVAGASGVDFVLLVIAADDGVMPQTREHLQIMKILGIEHGMTVLTKTDAVDEELLELVQEEVRDYLAGTFLGEAPLIPVSNVTGEGIDLVAAELRRRLVSVRPREATGAFRMPIQRAFSIKGHGTVVTGVPTSGVVRVGDELELLPRGVKTRVRGIQVHHEPARQASTGHRAALNVADVSYRDVRRGDVVAAPGVFGSANLLEARLNYLDHFETPLRNATPIRFHAGTADVGGRVVLLDHDVLLPGDGGLVQLRLDEPVVIAVGDPFVLRMASPMVTLGGGRVLGETRWRFKRFRQWLNETLQSKEEHVGDRKGYLEYVIKSHGKRLVKADELVRQVWRTESEVLADLAELEASGAAKKIERDKAWIHADMFKAAGRDALEALMSLHDAERLTAGFHPSAIAKAAKMSIPLAEAIVADLIARTKVESLPGGLVRHKKFTGGLPREDYRLVKEIEAMHETEFFGSPIRSEIVSALGRPAKKVKELMNYLFQMGVLVPISEDLALHVRAMQEAEIRLVRRILEGGPMPSKEFKDVIGASRKYVIPILEFFDKKGITKRDGNERVLVDRWEKKAYPPTLEAIRGEASRDG